MLVKNILFKNNLTKIRNTTNILGAKKKFSELKKNYEENRIPLLSSFEKNYKFNYSKKLIKFFKKDENIILVGMGGSILGAKAIYSFLKKK